MVGDEWRHTSLICACIVSAAGAKDISPEDFSPYKAPERQQTQAEIIAALETLNVMWGNPGNGNGS